MNPATEIGTKQARRPDLDDVYEKWDQLDPRPLRQRHSDPKHWVHSHHALDLYFWGFPYKGNTVKERFTTITPNQWHVVDQLPVVSISDAITQLALIHDRHDYYFAHTCVELLDHIDADQINQALVAGGAGHDLREMTVGYLEQTHWQMSAAQIDGFLLEHQVE